MDLSDDDLKKINKLEPIDLEDFVPRLKEQVRKGEIKIIGIHCFDKDGHKITDKNGLAHSLDIEFVPGDKKEIPHGDHSRDSQFNILSKYESHMNHRIY